MIEGQGWRCLWEAKAILGEGTIWDERDGCIYWVDIEDPGVRWYELATGQTGCWKTDKWISALAPKETGGFIASWFGGIAAIDPKRGTFQPLFQPVPDPTRARLNDGAVDRKGRYWTGSCDSAQWDETTTADDKEASLGQMDSRSTGELYRIEADGSFTTQERDIVSENGPAFSPDGKTLYLNDSMPQVTWAYDLDASGNLSNRREFLRFKPEDGYPDGMAVDKEGHIWMAFYESWKIRRFAPDGTLSDERQLPVMRGLRPAFGGTDFSRLFLITGSQAYSAERFAQEPLAGGLFEILDLPAPGLPTLRYAG